VAICSWHGGTHHGGQRAGNETIRIFNMAHDELVEKRANNTYLEQGRRCILGLSSMIATAGASAFSACKLKGSVGLRTRKRLHGGNTHARNNAHVSTSVLAACRASASTRQGPASLHGMARHGITAAQHPPLPHLLMSTAWGTACGHSLRVLRHLRAHE